MIVVWFLSPKHRWIFGALEALIVCLWRVCKTSKLGAKWIFSFVSSQNTELWIRLRRHYELDLHLSSIFARIGS